MEMSLWDMWVKSGFVAKSVIITLFILSIWSIKVMIEKYLTYRAAKKETIDFLPNMARFLKENNLQGAIDCTKKFNKAHTAKVVGAGLLEYSNAEGSKLPFDARVESTQRALDAATAITSAEFKRGLGLLGTVGSTSPFIGLFGTVFGIINAFSGMALTGSGGLAAVSAGIAEALITTAFGLLVAIPAVMAFNHFTDTLERYQIEMVNASSELVDYFLKKGETSHAR